MSTQKHTPGPWLVTDEGSQIVIQTFEEHPTGTLARMYGTDELARADAALIAAAPDLLAALRALVNGKVRVSAHANDMLSEHDPKVIAARKAIFAATEGVQP